MDEKDMATLVREWTTAVRQLEDMDRRRREAVVDLDKAANALGARLAPDDMATGETIAVWARINRKQERLIVVTKTRTGDFTLAFRGAFRGAAPVEGDG